MVCSILIQWSIIDSSFVIWLLKGFRTLSKAVERLTVPPIPSHGDLPKLRKTYYNFEKVQEHIIIEYLPWVC